MDRERLGPEQDDAGENDTGSVVTGVLVVPGCGCSPALDSVEGAFDDVAVSVQRASKDGGRPSRLPWAVR
jgi:hypothetical protein